MLSRYVWLELRMQSMLKYLRHIRQKILEASGITPADKRAARMPCIKPLPRRQLLKSA